MPLSIESVLEAALPRRTRPPSQFSAAKAAASGLPCETK